MLLLSVSACKASLVDDLYQQARQDDVTASATAFALLSTIALSESELQRIRRDYDQEKKPEKRFYFEFLLAKRTQEDRYARAFVRSASSQLAHLIENKTRLAAISSPFYDYLALLAKSDDQALALLIELVNVSDGAHLSVLADDLAYALRQQPARMKSLLDQAEITLEQIEELAE